VELIEMTKIEGDCDPNSSKDDEDSSGSSDAKKYGVTQSSVTYFHYRGYKYTSLGDAVSQAKRDEAAATGGRP
jgi:hypothetical protein